MATCERCGRELKDSTARYGWRCAQILGFTNENPKAKPDKWNQMGYRVMYKQANHFLSNVGIDAAEIDQNMFYDAFADLFVAEFYGEFRTWEDAFWRIVTAVCPSFSAKGERIPASVHNFAMDVYVSLIRALEGMGLRKSLTRIEKYELEPDTSVLRDLQSVPRNSNMPVKPELVLDQMVAKGDAGSFVFWTEKLDALGGKSRMEAWTFPVDLENIDKNGQISYNFREERPGRKHAAIDIHTFPNSPIHAVTDGIVVYQGEFYKGKDTGRPVYQVMVLNFDGSVVRYGEMHDMPIARGTIVRQGDIVGYTKRMDTDRMLHIEVYENADTLLRAFDYSGFGAGSGPYSNVKGTQFNRRSDLINPTMFGALGIYRGAFYDHTWDLSPNYDLIAND